MSNINDNFNASNIYNYQSEQASVLNKNSCANPTYIQFDYNDHIDPIMSTYFANHGFNQPQKCTRTNPTHKHFKMTCQKYSGKSHSQYCNGGHILKQWIHTEIQDVVHVTKVPLHRILSLYCNTFSNASNNICNFVSLTYEINDLKQRIEFLSNTIDCTNTNPQYNKTWVLKENKHQGKGVHFFNNHKQIYRLLFPNKTEQQIYYPKCQHIAPIPSKRYLIRQQGFTIEHIFHPNFNKGYRVKYDGLLIQQFISNPLLIYKKIFHVRAMYLIVSFSPFIVLLYPDAFLVRSWKDFDSKLSSETAVRTNSHVQEKTALDIITNGNQSMEQYGTWGYKRFQRYLDEVYGEKLFNYTTEKLPNDIKQMAKHIFAANAYYNEMNNISNRSQMYDNIDININWDIWCMDIAITDEFQIKLLEINPGRCGSVCDPDLRKDWIGVASNDGAPWWCHGFAHDAVNILLEIYQKKIDNITITQIDNIGRFDIIYLQQ